MRAADPVHNVELRRNPQGHDSVVFAFPYRADIVDAVRAIPGRRFDWEAKEWWAPRADAVAPFVKGVLERHPTLSVAPDVAAWLSRAVTGWIGRVTAGKLDGGGHFVLETIAGELEEPLAELASERGGRLWLPFTQVVAEALLETRGARLDQRALRCASRLQVDLEPAPATLALVEGYGELRFKLDINWDPETLPAFLALPACEAHGRTLPVDPYLLEPLEHYLRTVRGRAGRQRARGARPAAPRARRGDRRRAPLARRRRAGAGGRGAPGRRAAAVPARGRGLRAAGAAHVPGRRAGPRQDRAGARRARGRRRLPGRGRLPGVPEAQLAAGDRALAAAPLADGGLRHRRGRRWTPRSRSSTTRSSTPTARGCSCGGRRRWSSTSPTTSRTRAPSARRPCAAWPRALPDGRAEAGADRHAGDEPPGGADRAAADPRPPAGVRLRRALRPPLPGRRRGGAHPLAPAPLLLRAPPEGRRAAPAARQAPGRGARRARQRRASTGSPRTT